MDGLNADTQDLRNTGNTEVTSDTGNIEHHQPKYLKWKFNDEDVIRSSPEDKKRYEKIQASQHRSMDPSVWHTETLNTDDFYDGFTRKSSKREETDAKLQERGFMITTNQNPFLNNDYVKDIQNQEEFLKPKMTNL